MSISGFTSVGQSPPTPPTPPESNGNVDEVLEALLSRIKAPGIDEKMKLMIYAGPGAGKTTLAGSAPHNLVLDTEKSTSALSKGARASIVKDDVQILPYKSWATFEAIVNKLADGSPELAKFEVFTVDTATELHKRGLAEKVGREWNRLQAEWANAPSQIDLKKSQYKAETEQQAENNEHMRQLIDSLRSMDRHIIVLCHARRIERKNKADIIQPDFSEKLADTLMAMMDIVGYLEETPDGERRLHTHTDGEIKCKSRIPLPNPLPNPTFDYIKEVWDKAMEEEAKNK